MFYHPVCLFMSANIDGAIYAPDTANVRVKTFWVSADMR
jgi:hypothetical protein